MFSVIWTYMVADQQRDTFREHYHENGSWAKLFQQAEGYLHTEFFQNADHPERFLTIDRWRSRQDYDRFFELHREAYLALDTECGELTQDEELVATLDE
jgi:heme-degrading monooxygenase HmoA